MTVVVTLPYPPTANNMHTVARGRKVKSTEYKAWRQNAEWSLVAQRVPKTCGPFHVRFYVTRPDRRARDLDNLTKPMLDAIKAAGLIDDDHLAESILLAWRDLGSEPGVTAEIESVHYTPAVAG